MRLIDADKMNLLLGISDRDIYAKRMLDHMDTVDAVPVTRCRDCINAEPLERNCELNANIYMHCRLWRGEECKNVWHKYKRYYRDYSLVQHDDFLQQRRTEGRCQR